MIPAHDFERQWEDLRDPVLAALLRVASSGRYILGGEVREFEAELAAYWGVKHAISVASGLDAIEISLRILGCQPGDRVLTTPLSAFATTLAILKLGAIPVFVDTDAYGLIDLERCREVLSRRPEIRFFVPVHLYGHALDMGGLRMLREEFGLSVVEDCAQSIGARFRGEATGTASQLAATSFYPTKNLGALGDGGAILTDGMEWRDRAAALRDYGQTSKYRHEYVGYNSRLDELQAAVLRHAMLPSLDAWKDRRRAVAREYLVGIRHPEIRCLGIPEGSEPNWHLFPVLAHPQRKSAFLEYLQRSGVTGAEHYPVAIPDQPAMNHPELADDCSNARRLAASEVSLPIHPYLRAEEIARVIDVVNAF